MKKESDMNKLFQNMGRVLSMALLCCLAACSDEGGEGVTPPTDKASGEMTFRLSTKASALSDEQLVRLFVVERKQEHSTVTPEGNDKPTTTPDYEVDEPLHVE